MKLTTKNSRVIAYLNLFMLLMLGTLLPSCGIYSFTGISTTADHIFVGNFENRVSLGPPNLSLTFTEALKEYYQRNSPLKVGDEQDQLVINGTITRYEVRPIAATGNDEAAQNRLTIAVEVDYVDNQQEEKSFVQTFSFYSDFPQEQTLSQVEQEKIDEIFEQIILDIFNKTLADW